MPLLVEPGFDGFFITTEWGRKKTDGIGEILNRDLGVTEDGLDLDASVIYLLVQFKGDLVALHLKDDSEREEREECRKDHEDKIRGLKSLAQGKCTIEDLGVAIHLSAIRINEMWRE